jgi:hypothetical protein
VDAAIVFQIVAGTYSATPEQQYAADADRDSRITLTDGEMILHWAAYGLGTSPPSSLTETIEMPVLSSQTGTTGTSISLPSGAALRVPEGQLPTGTQITLSEVDPSEVDDGGNKACYQISPDVSYYSGSTLSVPLQTGETRDDLEGVAICFYSPWKRVYDMEVVEYEVEGETLSIDLGQIRSGEPDSLAQDFKLIVFVVRNLPPRSALSSGATQGQVSSQASTNVRLQASANVPGYVPYYEQGESGYCWAACTAMAVNYYRVPPAGVKPWDPAKYLGLYDNDPGLNTWWLRAPITDLHALYKSYLRSTTNGSPALSFFLLDWSLQRHVRQQIDAGRPILMGITHMGHQVVVLGYITDSTGNISRVIIHDPDESMYKSERWAHISRPWAFETVHTRVIENIAPRYTDGISINVLSRKEGLEEKQGVTFKSPMNNEINRRHFFRNGDIRFGWCRSETKEHGYVSHDGTGITVGAIPNYYAMKLNLRVANTNSSRDAVYNPSQLKVKWYMTKMTGSGGTAENYSGEHTDHAVGTLVSAKFKFRQDSFQDLEGDYLLHVTASDQAGEKIYDEFSISLSFDKGIKLSVEKGPDDQAPSKQVVKLTWTAFSGDFDKYEVFRRYSVTSDWTSIGEVSKDTTKYSDDDSRSLLEDEVYYGVVAKKGKKIIITSNMAKLEKVQGHLAYRFAYFDDQQNLETGIGFFYLPTSETWEWYSNPGHDLHLIGVTPSGRGRPRCTILDSIARRIWPIQASAISRGHIQSWRRLTLSTPNMVRPAEAMTTSFPVMDPHATRSQLILTGMARWTISLPLAFST